MKNNFFNHCTIGPAWPINNEVLVERKLLYVISDTAARDLEVLHFSGPTLKNYKYYKMCIFMKSK